MKVAPIAVVLVIGLLLGLDASATSSHANDYRRCSKAQISACHRLLKRKLSRKNRRIAKNNLGVAYYLRANDFIKKRDWDKAIRYYWKGRKYRALPSALKQSMSEVFVLRGNSLARKGSFDAAIKDYSEAIKLRPKSSLAYLNRGNVLLVKEGKARNALDDFKMALKYDPNNFGAYVGRGLALKKMEDLTGALRDFDLAIRLIKAEMRQRIDGKGNKNEAASDSDSMENLEKLLARTYFARGEAHGLLNNLAEAIADMKQVIRLNPDYPDAKSNLEMLKSWGEVEDTKPDVDGTLRDGDTRSIAHLNSHQQLKSMALRLNSSGQLSGAEEISPDVFTVAYTSSLSGLRALAGRALQFRAF